MRFEEYQERVLIDRRRENRKNIDASAPWVREKVQKYLEREGFDTEDQAREYFDALDPDDAWLCHMGIPKDPRKQGVNQITQRSFIKEDIFPRLNKKLSTDFVLTDLNETGPSAITVRSGNIIRKSDVEFQTNPKALDNAIYYGNKTVYMSLKDTKGQGGHQGNADIEISSFLRESKGGDENTVFIAVVSGDHWTDDTIEEFKRLESERVFISQINNLGDLLLDLLS